MSTVIPAGDVADRAQRELLAKLVDDLALLARLHDREADAGLLQELRTVPCRDWFSLRLEGSEAEVAAALMDDWLAGLPDAIGGKTVDELAADFTELYLTYARRVSASESVWLTEEHLERQEPMFAVRKWYRHYGLEVPDWRNRPDDHLVHQLQFVAHLLGTGEPSAVADAGRFLDDHLLAWVDDFAAGLAARADTPFYAALGIVTRLAVLRLRDIVEALSGEVRNVSSSHSGAARDSAAADGAPADGQEPAFVPGAGPGW